MAGIQQAINGAIGSIGVAAGAKRYFKGQAEAVAAQKEATSTTMKSIEMHDKAMQSLQDALESKTLKVRGLEEQNKMLQAENKGLNDRLGIIGAGLEKALEAKKGAAIDTSDSVETKFEEKK